jgi:hypothetical protein
MMKAIMSQNKYKALGVLVGGLFLCALLVPARTFADPALRYERASNRVERRDVRSSGRIENRQDRSGNRIEHRDERISNRIERRDMLFSPPVGATAVNVEGVRCYRVGADVYKPAMYEGETVYMRVGAD